jgi:exopolysaccharide biosynthesis protein
MPQIKTLCETYDAAYSIGEVVRLNFSGFDGGSAGLITGIVVRPGVVLYLVTWADNRGESMHYGIELECVVS